MLSGRKEKKLPFGGAQRIRWAESRPLEPDPGNAGAGKTEEVVPTSSSPAGIPKRTSA